MTKLSIALLAGALTLAASLRAFRPDAGDASGVPPPPPQSACERWRAASSNLTDKQRAALQKDGAVRVSGAFLLREDLVEDCGLRWEISEYLIHSLGRMEEYWGPEGTSLARRHSKEIVTVLRRLWPSLSGSEVFTGDGLGDAKYDLLYDPALDEGDLAPFVTDILKAESLGNGEAGLLFRRPMRQTTPVLLDSLRGMERIESYRGRILTLAVLHKLGEGSALPKLKALSKERCLSELERKYVDTLVGKAERGEEIVFSDIEHLEIEDDTLPPAAAERLGEKPCRNKPAREPAKGARGKPGDSRPFPRGLGVTAPK
ncbi:MAG: hypothetical protein LC795_15155 [Acidobacteria bacterium]|nr:hypothetical protein [Acidobacteriota bacterium]